MDRNLATRVRAGLTERGLIDAVSALALEHNVLLDEVLGAVRTKRVSECRRAVYSLLKDRGFSYPEIGRMLGQADHTSALVGVRLLKAVA